MIRLLVDKLQAALRKQGAPLRVVAGPEVLESISSAHERVVLERSGDDAFGGPIRAARNPREPLSRVAGVTLRILAQSTVAGATIQDHYERAEHILETALTELDAVVRSLPLMPMQVGVGRWVDLVDAQGTRRFSGAVYEVQIGIVHALARRKWDGSAAREVTLGPGGVEVVSTTKVSTAPIDTNPLGDPPADASVIGG